MHAHCNMQLCIHRMHNWIELWFCCWMICVCVVFPKLLLMSLLFHSLVYASFYARKHFQHKETIELLHKRAYSRCKDYVRLKIWCKEKAKSTLDLDWLYSTTALFIHCIIYDPANISLTLHCQTSFLKIVSRLSMIDWLYTNKHT